MTDLVAGMRSRRDGGWRRHNVGQAGIAVATACLIFFTWVGTYSAMQAERRSARIQVETTAYNQAVAIAEKFSVQMLGYEQSIRVIEREWERAPGSFRLQTWTDALVTSADGAIDYFVTDEAGRIVQSSEPHLLGVDLSDRQFFKQEAALPSDDGLLSVDRKAEGVLAERWSITISRRLDDNNRFAGIVGATFHSSSLGAYFRRINGEAPGGVMLLLGQTGHLRAAEGITAANPGQSVAGSSFFGAVASGERSWIGPTAPDGIVRIHGFYRLPDRNVSVVVGYERNAALLASNAWQRGAIVFALGITVFLLLVAGLMIRDLRAARERERRLARGRVEQERAYMELRAAKNVADAKTRQLEVIFAGMSDGVSLVDGNLRLIQWNARFCDLAGLSPSALWTGMPFASVLRMQANAGEFGDVDVEAEVARRVAALHDRPATALTERDRPNGTTIELRRTSLASGGFVTLFCDISARKRAEEADRKARAAAEAAAEEKSRFAAIVSHEIRTPLNTLLNSLRLLSRSSLPSSERRIVMLAHRAGDALHDLLNDILELAKLEAGSLTLRQGWFELRPLLAGVTDLFQPLSGTEAETTLRLDVSPDVPARLYADPGRLRQILLNLVSNAVKFSAAGEITVSARCEGAFLMLRVCDPGPAIAPEHRDRLFDAFSRIEQADGSVKPGSGLGLAICRKIVLLLGGDIGWAAIAAGNCFWVRLPIVTSGSTLEGEQPIPDIVPRTRILLVDDVPANQAITATLLERLGHAVEVACSAAEAVALADTAPFDIILMDLCMPGTDGLETARMIRALHGPGAATPIIALTGNTSDETRAQCLRAGMQDLVCKPLDVTELQRLIVRNLWGHYPEPARLPSPERVELPEPVLATERLEELRRDMRDEVVFRLFASCISDLRGKHAELEAALADGDGAAAQAAIHSTIGVAASYGMAALARCARSARDALQRGDADAGDAAVPALRDALADAERAVSGAFRTERVG